MEFIPANKQYLQDLCRVTDEAKAQLKGLGIDQWQKGYPSREVWEQDFVNQTGLLAVEDGKVLAACAYLTSHDPSYTTIDGAWLTGDIRAYGSLHRVCVAQEAKGQGVVGQLFAHACDLARGAGLPSVRIDTHEGNVVMRRMLEKNGFVCDMATAKYKGDRMTVVYLKDEIGGFAYHLVKR